MADLKKLKIPVSIDSSKAADGIEKMDSAMGRFGSRLKSGFAGIAAGAATTAIAVSKFISIFGGYEQSIANVAAVSGSSRQALGELAREMGANSVFSAKEAADAMYFLASAGLAVEEQAQVLPNVLNLAAAAQIDLATASDITTNTIKSFGLNMSDSGMVVDTFTKAIQKSNTDMTQLGEAMGYVAPIAKTVGISLKDTTSILGALADRGIKGSQAGAQLRQTFARLAKPTSAAAEALSKYGISTEEVSSLLPTPIELFKRLNEANLSTADAIEILGVRQTGVFSVIKDGLPSIEALSGELENAGGNAENMAKEQIDTLGGSIKLLQSAFEELVIGAGESGFSGFLKLLVKGLTNIIGIFQKLPGPIKVAGMLLLTLVPIGYAIQASFGPIGLLIGGITLGALALAGAMKEAKEEVSDLTKEFENAMNSLDEFTDSYTELEKKIDPDVLAKKLRNASSAAQSLADRKRGIKSLENAFSNFGEQADKSKKEIEKNDEAIKKLQERLKALKESGGLEGSRQIAKDLKSYEELIKKNEELLIATKEYEEKQKAIGDEIEKRIMIEREGETFLKSKQDERLSDFQKNLAEINKQIENTEILDVIGDDQDINDRLRAFRELMIREEEERVNGAMALRKSTYEKGLAMGVSFEKSYTDMSQKAIEDRIKLFQDEQQRRFSMIGAVMDLAVQAINIGSSLIKGALEKRADLYNEYNEQLNRLNEEQDEAERVKNEEKLRQELALLSKRSDAKSIEQARSKQMELQKIDLERKSLAEEKRIAVEQSKLNRKKAIADRVAALAGVVRDTAKAVMGAVAQFPATLGQPWKGLAIATGVAQGLAVSTAPLPPIVSAAKGGSMVTNGLTGLIVGDNFSGREEVTVRPMGGNPPSKGDSISNSKISIAQVVLPGVREADQFEKELSGYVKSRGGIPARYIEE